MAEITGGQLNYSVTVDVDQLKKGLSDAEGNIQGFSDVVEKAGENIDSAFVEALKTIEAQKNALAELQKKYDDLQKTSTKIGNDEEVAAYTQEINRLKEEIDLYKNKINEMNKVLESFSDKNVNLSKDLEEVREKIVKTTSENYTIEAIGVTKENIVIQKQYIKELESQLKELQKTIDGIAPSKAKLTVMGEASAITKDIELEKKALIELEEALRNTEKEHISLREKLSTVRSEMEALSADNKRNTDEYNELKEKAQEYSAQLKQVADDLKPNIDNHDNLREKLSSVKDEMEALMLSGKGQSEEYEELKGKAQEYSQMIVQVAKDIKPLEEKNATLQSKLRAVKEEMLQLAAAGQKDSAQYGILRDKAIDYQNELQQMNKELKSLSGSTSITALVDSLGLLSGGMATANGFIALFAGSNENLDDIMVRLQATMSAAIGIQQIQNSLSKESSVIQNVVAVQTLARAKAEALATKNTIGATIAQRAFNLVAKANPYVLLATALVTVVGALVLFSGKTKKAAEDQEKLNKATADGAAESIVKYKQLQTAWNALGGDLKKQQKYIEENKDKFHDLGVEVDNVNEADKFLIQQSKAVENAFMLRAEAAAYAQIAVEKYKEAILADKEIEQFDKDWKNAGFFGKIGLGAKAVFTGLDDKKGGKLRDDADSVIKMQTDKLAKAKAEMDKAAKELSKSTNPNKTPKTKTPKQVADEVLPPGSVAEIQKRLSAIDQALSKATDKGAIEALKKKRIAAAEELAEALKKIEIKSLEDRASAQEKYSEDYNIIAELKGKEAADKMYGPLMEGAQSYYGWLTNEQDKLIQKGGLLSETDKQNLVFLTQKINEIEGKKNAFQNFTDGIDEALAKIPTLSGQLEFLQNKAEEQLSLKGNKSFDDGEQKFLKEKQDALLQQQKENYQQFLNEHKSFEEQKDAITEKYNNLRAQAKGDKIAIAKIDKAEQNELSNLTMEIIKQSAEWQTAFGEMEYMSKNALDRILASLLEFKAKSAATLAPTEMRELEEAIKRVEAAQQRNPFTAILRSFTSYKTALQTVTAAQLAYNKAVAEFGRNSKEAQAAQEKLTRADINAAKAKQNLVGSLQKGQEVFNAIGNGVKDLGDAFGGFDEATNDAIGNIMDIGNAAFDLGKSIASGDIAGMISAGIKLIGSIGKALNGDQKKERNIKKQAAQLKQLEIAYNSLAFAAERAFGSMKYSGQTDLIRNLEQQKAVIQGMLNTENSKKKKDNEKIAGYQSQIQQINQSIAQIKEGIIKDVLQTDVIDAASKVGDALVDAFSRGEDSVKSLENAANDMIKNLLRNQLNLALQNKMKPILDQLLATSGFNQDGTGTFTGLTPEQIAAFKAQVVAAGQSMQGFLEGYADIFGSLDPANAQGLKGDIKGITEKTAGALEAQINAMRQYQVEGLNIHRNNQQTLIASLQNLIMIEANTRNLIQIRQDISEMNGKMAKGLAGI